MWSQGAQFRVGLIDNGSLGQCGVDCADQVVDSRPRLARQTYHHLSLRLQMCLPASAKQVSACPAAQQDQHS